MESGKMVVVALISALSTYAAMAAWPALKELIQPEISGAAVVANPNAVQSAPQPIVSGISAASLSGTAVAATPPPPVKRTRSSSSPAQGFQRLPVVAWDYSQVKYARVSVILRNRPGGDGVKAISLSKAPLTVLRGTRLMPVREKGKWVMVQAPSAELGWVKASELTNTRPVTVDHYKLR